MNPIAPDQQTAYESAPDEAHVGRFSNGLEALPPTPAKLHRGRFSEGLERIGPTVTGYRPGRFSDGLEGEPETPAKLHRGSFADRESSRPRRSPPRRRARRT
jgi:hypothetical protein